MSSSSSAAAATLVESSPAVSSGGGGSGGSGDNVITRIAVLAPPDSPALLHIPPPPPGVTFTVGNSVADFVIADDADDAAAAAASTADFDGLVFIPPASPTLLVELWPSIRHSCKWVHSFFAGVDGFRGFFDQFLLKPDGSLADDDSVAFTNGKGAFSDSLAEYVPVSYTHLTLPTIYSV